MMKYTFLLNFSYHLVILTVVLFYIGSWKILPLLKLPIFSIDTHSIFIDLARNPMIIPSFIGLFSYFSIHFAMLI